MASFDLGVAQIDGAGGISVPARVRMRAVPGALAASASVAGDTRLNKFRIGGLLAAAATVTSSPYPWYGATSAPPVRGQFAAMPDAVGSHAFAITPSDFTVFSPPTRWLWIGSTGTLTVVMNDGGQIAFGTVPVGRLPLSVQQVLSTGTSASAIVGVT